MFGRRKKCALLIDFDNVLGMTSGEFTTSIAKWMEWLEDGAFDEKRQKRKFLIKRVYWNPLYDRYRDPFEAAGFEAFACGAIAKSKKSSADMVITARNLHNWAPNAPFLEKVLKDAHAVLKPGGVLAVEEHRSDPKPSAEKWSTGYMSQAEVIAMVEKAGFKLAAKSEVNANPKDTKDHPFGVWTLPPSRWTVAGGRGSDPNFDRAKYDAIGESDRMTLKFVKVG